MSLETTYAPLSVTPPERRAFTAKDAFALWFSLGIGLLVLQAGALLTPALDLQTAMLAILCGTVIGVALLAAAGVVGADAGLSAMATLRPSLGVRGAMLPALLNVVQLVGWGTFEIIVMADAANTLTKSSFGVEAPTLWTLFFGALATGLAVAGPLSFVRKFLSRFGLPLIVIVTLWLSWALFHGQDLGALAAKPGTGGLSFGAAVDIVAAMPLSWLPVIADYTRFGRTPGAMFSGSAIGYVLANVWFYALGALYALTAGPEASVVVTLAAAGGGLALLFILVDETDNAFAAIHSAAVSGGSVAPVGVPKIAFGFGLLCTIGALTIPMAQYEGFLLLIGSVFAPLFGVALVDHFVLRRRKIAAAEIDAKGGAYWFSGGFRLAGLVSWAIGVAAYQAINATLPDLGATLPSFAISAVAFLALSRFGRRAASAA